jgi:hypothetical protein
VLTLLGRLLLHCSFGVKGLISLAWFLSHLRFRFPAVMQECYLAVSCGRAVISPRYARMHQTVWLTTLDVFEWYVVVVTCTRE